MAAVVNCQNINYWKHERLSNLYQNGKKGERARHRRDRERESVWEREDSCKTEVALVAKRAVGETDHLG